MVNIDETQPLLAQRGQQLHQVSDQPLIDFDPNGDSENPLDWRNAYKQFLVVTLAFTAFAVTFTCLGVIPVAESITAELGGRNDKSASVLLVTIWELGEATGPLLIAPLSELYGRYPVYNISNLLLILGTVMGALSQTTNIFLFSRFLCGCAVASNVLGPAIIGDIFRSENRGSGMALLMLAPLAGGAVGPSICGALAQRFGWRIILWTSAGMCICCELMFFLLFRETYKVTILQRRAARLRKETNNESLKCVWEAEDTSPKKFWPTLRVSVLRPLVVAYNSSVLQILALYGGFPFAFFYIMSTTMPGLLRDVYQFSPTQTGVSFLSFSIGATSAIVICNLFLDNLYIRLGNARGGVPIPENRLPFLITGSLLLPLGIALFGWAPHLHWPVLAFLFSAALNGFFVIIIMVPLSSYVVDAFGIYSASAMTVILVVRCLGGTLLPLAIPPLTEAFGVGHGFLIVAAVYLVLTPLPAAVMRYGMRWRQKSIYTRDE